MGCEQEVLLLRGAEKMAGVRGGCEVRVAFLLQRRSRLCAMGMSQQRVRRNLLTEDRGDTCMVSEMEAVGSRAGVEF